MPELSLEEHRHSWRSRRLVKDYEGYAKTLVGFHIVAFACLMLKHAAEIVPY